MPRKALAKATPAMADALCMPSRASRLSGLSTAAFRCLWTRSVARAESAILGIHDGHVGREHVVGDWVLVAVVPGDDGEWGHLSAGAGCGGDADHLLDECARTRELTYALAYVKKSRVHVLHFDLRVLVHEAHHLGRVEGRAAAESDHRVRFEGVHRSDTFPKTREGGLGGDVGVYVPLGKR
eukprot:scaffold23177_cov28-Tisochrysis_lutea.AAC.2